MKEGYKGKIINIFLISCFCFVNVFGVLPVINKVNAKDEVIYSEDDINYVVGSAVIASQGGVVERDESTFQKVVTFGHELLLNYVDNGGRIEDIILHNGKEIILNPTFLWKHVENIYRDFAEMEITYLKGDTYTIYVNNTYSLIRPNSYGTQDVYFSMKDYAPDLSEFNTVEWFVSNMTGSTSGGGSSVYPTIDDKMLKMSLPGNKGTIEGDRDYDNHTGANLLKAYDGVSYMVQVPKSRLPISYVGIRITEKGYYTHIDKIVLSKSEEIARRSRLIPYNETPDNNIIINNYNNTFLKAYDVHLEEQTEVYTPKNEIWYSYDMAEFMNDKTVINNEYIASNYITIINEKEEDDFREENKPPVLPSLPETPSAPEEPPAEDTIPLLQQILKAIKALPQQILDKFEDFSGGGSAPEPVEEGKGFWASLFDAIAGLAKSFGEFITGIPDLLLNLLDGLLDLVEKVVSLFIPTAEQMDQLKNSFSGLTDELSLKFAPVTDTVGAVNSIYSSPKSVYDLTMNFKGEEMPIIPEAFRDGISGFKPVLNGFIIVSTFISIYKRFVGREDIIK